MNISAIIAEYNPLHNGHEYQINMTKKITHCDGLIAIMSGNFVQRGEPSIIDKWTRAHMALANGVDLVLELPVVYSVSSAEFFAQGAVSLLDKLGIVDNVCFGSEIGEVDILKDIAKILLHEPEQFKNILKKNLDSGLPYPLARSMALKDFITFNTSEMSIDELISSSNNILGIEYCKSLLRIKSSIKPFTIKRVGGTYNSSELDNLFSSATSIRKIFKEEADLKVIKGHIPENSYRIIKHLPEGYSFVYDNSIFDYIKYKLLQSKASLDNIPDCAEGLSNRIYDCIINSNNYDELISKIKTKRYTRTRITRILCQYFIGFDQFNTALLRKNEPQYIRVLGFNSTGAAMLKKIKKASFLPIFTKLPQNFSSDMFHLDLLSTRMYSILNKSIAPNNDFLASPIIYK